MLLSRKLLFSVVLSILLISAVANAGSTADQTQSSEKTYGSQKHDMASGKAFHPELLSVNSLIGTDVVNSQEENLGKITEIVLNDSRDQVSFVAVRYGGIAGIGSKYFAVPWQALSVHAKDANSVKKVKWNIDRTKLESMPGFDKNNWPAKGNMNLTMGQEGEHSQHMQGMEHETHSMHKMSMSSKLSYCRVSELIGLTVRNLQGDDIGNIEGLMLDLHEGRPVYAKISFGGFLELGAKRAILPWSTVDVVSGLDIARIDTDKNTLAAIAFEQGDEPNLLEMDNATRLYQRFNEQPYWQVFGYVEPSSSSEKMMTDRDMYSNAVWAKGSAYNAYFDSSTMVTKTGYIESIGTFKPARDSTKGLRLTIKTDDGKSVTVYAGPQIYAAKQEFQLNYGDEVTITGSYTQVSNRKVIMASEIKHGQNTLQLRDNMGNPTWGK